jgi:SAM-dependent methyltransferase
MNWRDFWNSDTPIYVSERHKLIHYRLVANDILDLIISPRSNVLDYGCGEALFAEKVAAKTNLLYLCDGAPRVRESLAARYSGTPTIRVLAPEDMAVIPDGSLDLVVVNSLLQYLSVEELRRLLLVWRVKLKSDGRLVLADVLQPDASPIKDAQALISFAWRGGFLKSAVAGLARTAVSDYRRLRDEVGLSQYSESEIRSLLREAGLTGRRSARNLGHNQTRMTIIAQPSPVAHEDA